MVSAAFSASAEASTRILIKTRAEFPAAEPIPGVPGWVRLEVPEGNKRNVIGELSMDPAVEWVEEDQRYEAEVIAPAAPGNEALNPAVPQRAEDPLEAQQWSLGKIGVREAWARVPSSAREVVVAVIDTGIDSEHPDLKANLYTNPVEIAGNGIDDDRNGFVDDVHGWNFADQNADLQDDFNHGTHVAGIIGAVSGNGIGIAGIAPRVRILPVRWMKKGSGWGSDAIAAIHYAVKMGARVINASWGGIGFSKALEDAVRSAERNGVLFVASAGNRHSDNDVTPRHPANLRYPNVVAVASTDSADGLEPYSNYGATQVELGAPGRDILSTIPSGQYALMKGTSMAAPHVSAVAAILLAIEPRLRAPDLKRILVASAFPSASLHGRTVSGGRLDAARAAAMLRGKGNAKDAAPWDETDLSGPRGPTMKTTDWLRPDAQVEEGAAPGLAVRVVRMVKGIETPVQGLELNVQVHGDGTVQRLRSNAEGWILDPDCKKSSFSASARLETSRFQVTRGSGAYDLTLGLKCGAAQKIIFHEDSTSGQAIGIWQTLTRAEQRLQESVGLGFWKRPIEVVWPGKGDYYNADQVNLTAGHHWDVVAHELGHAIYDQAGIGRMQGGQHYIDRCYSETLALSEGWASFFSGWLHVDLADPDARFEYMVPRRAPVRFENIPADVCGKSGSEWRVTGYLWDLIDQHADGENTEERFARLWSDLGGARVPSVRAVHERLLERGWDRTRTREIWNLDFPEERIP